MSRVSDLKLKSLADEYGDLLVQFTAVKQAFRSETNPATRVTLEKQADQLLVAMEEIDKEMKAIEQACGDPLQRDNQWQNDLPYLDFEPASTIFEPLHTHFRKGGGAASSCCKTAKP